MKAGSAMKQDKIAIGRVPKVKRVEIPVPLEECIARALAYGKKQHGPVPASSFACAIWPDAKFIALQGAGAAASRVLKAMEKRGQAKWITEWGSGNRALCWGWVTTG